MNPAVFPRRIPPLAALSARSQVPWPNRPAARSPRRLPSPHPRIPCRPLSATSRCSLFGFGSDKNANPSSAEEEPLPYYSPHQPKRQWPPDVSKLSPKHQFRLERRYRRRAALKWERPRWKKWTKIVQYALYACTWPCAVGGRGDRGGADDRRYHRLRDLLHRLGRGSPHSDGQCPVVARILTDSLVPGLSAVQRPVGLLGAAPRPVAQAAGPAGEGVMGSRMFACYHCTINADTTPLT